MRDGGVWKQRAVKGRCEMGQGREALLLVAFSLERKRLAGGRTVKDSERLDWLDWTSDVRGWMSDGC